MHSDSHSVSWQSWSQKWGDWNSWRCGVPVGIESKGVPIGMATEPIDGTHPGLSPSVTKLYEKFSPPISARPPRLNLDDGQQNNRLLHRLLLKLRAS